MTVRLLVGLGNPGIEYHDTRHNAGVWFLEQWAQTQGLAWAYESRFQGRLAKISLPVSGWLLCPETYMNRSGQSVGALMRFYRLQPDEILVIHDELDLPPGVVRLKSGGGSGGHNGLKDIIAHVGTQDFWRLRVGIGHPGKGNDVAGFVLKRPGLPEMNAIQEALIASHRVMPLIWKGQFQVAMGQLHAHNPSP